MFTVYYISASICTYIHTLYCIFVSHYHFTRRISRNHCEQQFVIVIAFQFHGPQQFQSIYLLTRNRAEIFSNTIYSRTLSYQQYQSKNNLGTYHTYFNLITFFTFTNINALPHRCCHWRSHKNKNKNKNKKQNKFIA